MKMLNKKGNNKGFSLIEVLMAVVLLGLIATPILQMFYTSYQMNLKSKKYLAAADLANTVAEAISTQTFDESKTTGNVSVPGLKAYYLEASSPTYLFQTVNPAGTAITGPSVYASRGTSNDVYFIEPGGVNGIPYGGFRFAVSMEFTEKNTSDTFHSVDVLIKVYDATKGAASFGPGSTGAYSELSDVTVTVPNKRY